MNDFLDTSVVVRYLTADMPDRSERSRALIESDRPLWITETVVAEVAFVLKSGYGIGREAIVDLLIDLIQRFNVQTYGIDKDRLVRALLLCRPSGRVSIADALIWASANSVPNGVVYTFDRQFPSEGIDIREPGQDLEHPDGESPDVEETR